MSPRRPARSRIWRDLLFGKTTRLGEPGAIGMVTFPGPEPKPVDSPREGAPCGTPDYGEGARKLAAEKPPRPAPPKEHPDYVVMEGHGDIVGRVYTNRDSTVVVVWTDKFDLGRNRWVDVEALTEELAESRLWDLSGWADGGVWPPMRVRSFDSVLGILDDD